MDQGGGSGWREMQGLETDFKFWLWAETEGEAANDPQISCYEQPEGWGGFLLKKKTLWISWGSRREAPRLG